ncbi:MAG: hypothetical protein QXY39_03755 [Thermofilaceae archaeon]
MQEELKKILIALKYFGRIDRTLFENMSYDSYRLRLKVLKWMDCIDLIEGIVKPGRKFDKCLEIFDLKEESLKRNDNGEVAYLLLGDIHIGRKSSSFNYDVAVKRMNIIIDRVMQLKSQGYRILGFGLGDYIDGAGIYGRQAYEQEFDPNIQMVKFVEFISPLMDVIDGFYGISGNHGRVNDDELANYDYLAMETLRTMYKNKVVGSSRYVDIFDINGEKFLLAHMKFRMNYGIPDYSIRRFIFNQFLRYKDLSYIFMGHYHTFKVWNESDILVVLNGTFLSDDELSQQYGFKSSISQTFIIKNGKKIIIEEIGLE